jgi:hypothetical protein
MAARTDRGRRPGAGRLVLARALFGRGRRVFSTTVLGVGLGVVGRGGTPFLDRGDEEEVVAHPSRQLVLLALPGVVRLLAVAPRHEGSIGADLLSR